MDSYIQGNHTVGIPNKMLTPASKKISLEQKEKLIDFLEANFRLISGMGDSNVNATRQQKWEQLAMELNELGGVMKDVSGWKQCWKDLRKTARRRLESMGYTNKGSVSIKMEHYTRNDYRMMTLCQKIGEWEVVRKSKRSDDSFQNDSIADRFFCQDLQAEFSNNESESYSLTPAKKVKHEFIYPHLFPAQTVPSASTKSTKRAEEAVVQIAEYLRSKSTENADSSFLDWVKQEMADMSTEEKSRLKAEICRSITELKFEQT